MVWTLAPSLVVSTLKGWGELRSLATNERWELRDEDLPIVRALALGIPEADAGKHRELQAAVKLGWAAQADSLDDARVRERLEALERHYAWCRAAVPAAAHQAVVSAHASRRHMHRGFAQHAALPETIARRAALIGEAPKRVLVLGDDDFTSVALAALGHQVTVVEVDVAIAELTKRFAPGVSVVTHDLREPMPAALLGAFDAFVADPVSGPGALRLFMARGLAALAPGCQGYLCFGEASAQSFATLTRELDVEVVDQLSDFNHYHGPEYLLAPYVSDLAVLRARPTTTLRPRADEPYLVKVLNDEDHFLETPATRYTFKNVDPATCQIVHLDASMQVLERIGRLKVLSKSYAEDNGVRSYHVHTEDGRAVMVRVLIDEKVAELFVAPANSVLEDALITVLCAAFGVAGIVTQSRRVRGSTVYTMR